MEKATSVSEVSQDARIGVRRSRIERLQGEKALIEKRLAAAHEKRLAVERELRRAEVQARQAARKADARAKFLVGAAFLSLLDQGNALACELIMSITQITDKRDRDRVWSTLQLRHTPSTCSQQPKALQTAETKERHMTTP